MESFNILLGLLFLLTAYLYSSVGHGGASGYLVLMALFAFPQFSMKSTALVMNIFVAGIAFVIFYKKENFNFKLLLPFVIFSIPMAFWGARLAVSEKLYFEILGILLVIISFRFLFLKQKEQDTISTPSIYLVAIIGSLIGFISGMLGIGGGVILSPILILFGWSTIKDSTGIAAAFIFVNSISGIIGLYSKGIQLDNNIIIFVIIGIIGALAGAYSSIRFFSGKAVKFILSLVLLSAGIKLII